MATGMSSFLTPSQTQPINPPDSLQLDIEVSTETTSTTFNQTTQNLLKLGSLAMDKFAQDSSEELDSFDIPLVDPANPNVPGFYLGDTTATRRTAIDERPDEPVNVLPAEAVRYLRDVAFKEFGMTSTDPLKYEFLDEPGQNQKSCILTITRPNGLSRSYRTKAEFARKSEAKAAAASSAIQLGAIHFIRRGEAESVPGKRSMVLAKLDVGVKKSVSGESGQTESVIAPGTGKNGGEVGETNMNAAVDEIEKCCLEWRAGSVVPQWVYLVEQKLADAYGCALKISLSANIQRTYSVLVSLDYPRRSMAKVACAKVALEQDVLNFIKHGDGLEHPVVTPFGGAEASLSAPIPAVTTLQAFHAALPKPMPDNIGIKSNGEINAVAWLNNMVQIAKGSRMTATFHWHTDSKLGVHGCLLRLTRPDAPSRSYLVDAVFSKRMDAKLAVCLFACSQGLGNYVRSVAAEIEAHVSPEMRRRCAMEILPVLGQALNKVRHGLRPDFTFDSDLSAFGCTMTVDLSPNPDETEPQFKKQWSVPLAYKSKADAKIAVACAAEEDGLMDFIKFRRKENDDDASQNADSELEEGETTVESGKRKRKKKESTVGDDEGGKIVGKVNILGKSREVPFLETKDEGQAKGRFGIPGRGQQQRFPRGRGRGGAFGRHPLRGGFVPADAHGGISQPSFGSARRHPPSGPSGFPAYPNVPPYMSPAHPYPFPPPPVGAPHFHPYSTLSSFSSLAHVSGFPGGTYPFGYEQRDPNYHISEPGLAHGRHMPGSGRAGADTATSFAHAPSPTPSPVVPRYHGYLDREHDYGYARKREYHHAHRAQTYSGAVPPPDTPTLAAPPRPYDITYPDVAGDRPHPPRFPRAYLREMRAEYGYETNQYAGRPVQGDSRAFEPGHYAPDYDRIPDHDPTHHDPTPPHTVGSTTLHRSESRTYLRKGLPTPHPPPNSSPSRSNSSHSYASGTGMPPTQPTPPHAFGRLFNRTPPQTHHPRQVYDGSPVPNTHLLPMPLNHAPSLQAHPVSQSRAHSKIDETLDSVISRLEKEANNVDVGRLRDPCDVNGGPPWSPISAHKPSLSIEQKLLSTDGSKPAPHEHSKRERSVESEDEDAPSSKRARERSRSISQPSERGRSLDRRGGRKSSSGNIGSAFEHGKNMRGPEDHEPEVDPSPQDTAEDGSDVNILKRGRERSPTSKRNKGNEQEISYVEALFEHCVKEGLPSPKICHEEVSTEKDGPGDKVFKVWVIMEKERLELPTTFQTLTLGKERVAKSVLGRLRVQTKKREGGEAQ
ncbi:hypothetical protein K439DRAFT_1661156 [Ramaria rubella]|nr:hypothetical protein K439DRAFT_1661156 [Ramaria rubella]